MAYSAKYKPRPFTDVFTSDTDVNRRTCSRKVPMKVLILGLGRTGTACKFWFSLRSLGRLLMTGQPCAPP